MPPAPSPLQDKSFRQPGLYVPGIQQRVEDLGSALAPALTQQLAAFGTTSEYGLYDSRTGRWASLMLHHPLIPGTGDGNQLRWSDFGSAARPDDAAVRAQVWDALRSYLDRHKDALRVDLDELGAPRIDVFEQATFIVVYSPGRLDGIPVRDSSVTAVINHGNLVLLGLQNWGGPAARVAAAAGVGHDAPAPPCPSTSSPSPWRASSRSPTWS